LPDAAAQRKSAKQRSPQSSAEALQFLLCRPRRGSGWSPRRKSSSLRRQSEPLTFARDCQKQVRAVAFQRDGDKADVEGQPDPTIAQHAGTQDVEPDPVNLIDSHALFQPGTTGAGNTLSLGRLMDTAARANILLVNNPRLPSAGHSKRTMLDPWIGDGTSRALNAHRNDERAMRAMGEP
jgi:hypothetical protein